MATPNYGFEKRQRELAKKQKKEEKLRAKAAGKRHEAQPAPPEDAAGESSPDSAGEGAAPGEDGTENAG